MPKSSLTTARSRKPSPILICRKCLKRIPDGKRFKRALKSELKQRSIVEQRRRPRVVMTDCFGICPKRAVVVASGNTLHRGEYLVLSDSRAAAEAVTALTIAGD